MPDAGGAHRIQHVVGANDVLAQVFVGRILGRELHVGIGGEVVDNVDAFHPRGRHGRFLQVAFEKLESWIPAQRLNVLQLTAAQVVKDYDLLAASQQRGRQIASNAAGAPGHQRLHDDNRVYRS